MPVQQSKKGPGAPIPLWGPEIKFVLLDMDGTLLDKYFDDYFWEHLVPEKYSEKHGITFGRAKTELMIKYKRHEGTLNWTDIDFWSRELALDIPALKEQIKHLIEVHPHVEDFLRMLKRHRKKVSLVTNAHVKVLDLKMKKTNLGKYFDACITSFDLGHPKEDLQFWERARERLGFDNEKTLFIDDTVEILKTAKAFGIRYILYKARGNSRRELHRQGEFPAITDFKELLYEGI
ncbi:MAG TPA: HAD-IA family hydrolase [Thermodesulfovibrionales bacterium]|nr:HAD-IA family hydrolase [Thermodesulfovibrionales bacterium]